MGRSRFVFSYFVLLGILAIKAVAEEFPTTSTSLTYPRKLMMVHRALLIEDPPGDFSENSLMESENEIEKGPSSIVEAPESMETKHHHSDKSVAGGGVIIGGLVTAIFAAVYCYIRVTRKRDGDH
ncbi:putative xyloglucan endotransglucosylase/hydrolase protein 9 [Capsicum annuum]|uniref:Transmembrane protein n=1 Tax=Capsicum annuum TaxID=4072 RepID=A0A2G2Z2F4_CAPAN|nr:uncharacterized protein LOC107878277 [Capsicum annuum]KAF3650247.1 putative xyloglucan endotransglucosylase/hydrolase protein 9 [Capsicum annuum]KAF3660634.1 putative xyloglucan endotransglucosylase/hydrolase protein 9 [Capsicum annuum]PHT76176.1 hypothetical protein T459_19698 [Capsicum annuum]